MNIIYTLIIVMAGIEGKSAAIDSMDFMSKENCEVARTAMLQTDMKFDRYTKIKAICVRNG